MCNDWDAISWTGLSDIESCSILPGTTAIDIQENGTAWFIAISTYYHGNRIITYANNLNENGSFTQYATRVTYYSYNYYLRGKKLLSLELVGKDAGEWIVSITNKTNTMLMLSYNSLMCFADDAKKWRNLNNVYSESISPEIPITKRISENYFADYIAFSITIQNSRIVLFANQLQLNGSMAYYNPFLYLGIENVGTIFNGWQIRIYNPTDTSITVYYNTKMCFENDAQYWTNLADVSSVQVPANGSTIVGISNNFFATHVAISCFSSSIRTISYGNQLGSNGSITINHSYV